MILYGVSTPKLHGLRSQLLCSRGLRLANAERTRKEFPWLLLRRLRQNPCQIQLHEIRKLCFRRLRLKINPLLSLRPQSPVRNPESGPLFRCFIFASFAARFPPPSETGFFPNTIA